MIEQLADAPGWLPAQPFAGPDHPMRKVTRQVAFEDGWDRTRAGKVADLFDSMASEWSAAHVDDVKAAPLVDAIDRGDVPVDSSWLELGSGTGAGARVLFDRVDRLTTLDLSAGMLANAPTGLAPKVRGDASCLPFPADSFDVVLLINMLLFPVELDRVLRRDGRVLWVNTLGDQTPIHLPPDDVADALPGEWSATTARAGTGFWVVLRRAAS